jgi:aminopeptidase
MTFDLKKLITDVFNPQSDDVLTVMHDFPRDSDVDNQEWQERRAMATEWHEKISNFASNFGMTVNPLVTYPCTGSGNSDLPLKGKMNNDDIVLEDVIAKSTIIICMPEYSATAPLMAYTKKYPKLRVASMPKAKKSMEQTALSANYRDVEKRCLALLPLFQKAIMAHVTFSTGHKCSFDLSNAYEADMDTGILHPGKRTMRLDNLPAGETFICPNDAPDSQTQGEIPVMLDDQQAVFVIKNNKVVDVIGSNKKAMEEKLAFMQEPARQNIAEVAIGCNDKAVVTGNVLEDEKAAGFHWAYGRSDHLGGGITPKHFSSPNKVVHTDIIYAKKSPIECALFEFEFKDGSKKTVIRDGELLV